MDEMKYVLRRIARSPVFAFVTVSVLALGLGVNVAIFGTVYGVLLEPLPYPDADRLVVISHAATKLQLDDLTISPPLYLRYREQAQSFEEIGLIRDGRTTLTGVDVPARLRQGTVTSSIFRVFGVEPLLGRTFSEEDEKQGASPVAIISERLWRGRFGAVPDILGRLIEIDGRKREIVGVMPSLFEVPDAETDLWLPLILDPKVDHLGSFGGKAVACLRAQTSVNTATIELQRFTDDLTGQFPEEPAAPALARSGIAPRVRPLLEDIVGEVRTILWILLGAVGFLLLVVCANVTNLFLVRAEARQREIALRITLGASRARIVSSFFLEGLVLTLIGGGLSLLLAHATIRTLVGLAPQGVPRLHHVGINGPVLVFAITLSVLAPVLFALLPALPYGDPTLATVLRGRGPRTNPGRELPRQVLAAAQLALGLVLLIGAGLMARSLQNLSMIEPGFVEVGALTLRFSLPAVRYDSPERIAGFVDRLTEKLEGLPGVVVAGAVDSLPLTGLARGAGHVLEDFPHREDDVPILFMWSFASPGYLRAMGIPLIEGRWLEPADHQRTHGTVVISSSVARRYWPESSPLGRRIKPGSAEDDRWYTIVGVVGDVRLISLKDEPIDSVYYPMVGYERAVALGNNVSLVLRSYVAPETLVDPVRSAVWELDPNVPFTRVSTLEQLVDDARAPTTYSTFLLLAASALALLLASVGIYGVVSFAATQRTQEIGVRMALGALRGQIRAMVLRDGLRVALPGVGVGLLGAFAISDLMKSLIFGVSPLDPVTFAAVPIVLVTVAVVASLIPAERASRVDPAEVLRRDC